jgi:hypothetical protein
MFGQDDNMDAPSTGGGSQNDTLSGVDDLANGMQQGPAPAAPSNDAGFMPVPSEPTQASVPAPTEEAEHVASGAPAPAADMSGESDALLELKQKALQQLTPIVSHLDQTPEEKFRTTMMLIQASDNQALLKDAYEAAQEIGDEKLKAQALLDVINEINYFTQSKEQA